jgi:hypothetical protein
MQIAGLESRRGHFFIGIGKASGYWQIRVRGYPREKADHLRREATAVAWAHTQ